MPIYLLSSNIHTTPLIFQNKSVTSAFNWLLDAQTEHGMHQIYCFLSDNCPILRITFLYLYLRGHYQLCFRNNSSTVLRITFQLIAFVSSRTLVICWGSFLLIFARFCLKPSAHSLCSKFLMRTVYSSSVAKVNAAEFVCLLQSQGMWVS